MATHLSGLQRDGYCNSTATSSSWAPRMGGQPVATEAISAAWMIWESLSSSPKAFLWRSLRLTSTEALRRRRLLRVLKGSSSSSPSSSELSPNAGESRGVPTPKLKAAPPVFFRLVPLLPPRIRSSAEEG